nr:immunoglobulin heavy chain junction region [Macaca mulatta]MOX60076.1 immunoglobulin heavy chain junction region [Macaca mulatta]MOX61434.1 immunoglobulin heavy chain junction region [Macaca mulatta]MOX62045.1 immunoglobulin heavy chain junction region [Macaca mulatta]MOX62372.1 immunoglobulin heavy chain junction region [Macaca mulatta]
CARGTTHLEMATGIGDYFDSW